jgi:hypothetical protein
VRPIEEQINSEVVGEGESEVVGIVEKERKVFLPSLK